MYTQAASYGYTPLIIEDDWWGAPAKKKEPEVNEWGLVSL